MLILQDSGNSFLAYELGMAESDALGMWVTYGRALSTKLDLDKSQ